MPGNSLGQLYRITTFGESHGPAVGVVIDGCPSQFDIAESDIQRELDRRRPGQSSLTTLRDESDSVEILSGVFEGKTTGAPILLLVRNKDARPKDYEYLKNLYRPSHADFTYEAKYSFRDWRGSGRSSARETIARVVAGAIAQKYLAEKCDMEFLSFVQTVGDITTEVDLKKLTRTSIEKNSIRCPDEKVAKKMINLIEKIKKEGDSVGGIIQGIIRKVPVGLGEPVFDKLHADLGKAMLSINAVKGFEYGSGFSGVSLRGSEHNDEFYRNSKGEIKTKTNNSGGIQGGISNGMDIVFRVAFKPVSTIMKPQRTISIDKKSALLKAYGRHDPSVLPRAVPIVDAMAAIVMMDHYLRNQQAGGRNSK